MSYFKLQVGPLSSQMAKRNFREFRVDFGDSWWYYEDGHTVSDMALRKRKRDRYETSRLWGFFHRCEYPKANVGVLTRRTIPIVDKTIYQCERCEAEAPKQVRAAAMLKVIGEKR